MKIPLRLSLIAASLVLFGFSCSDAILQPVQSQPTEQQPVATEKTYTNSQFGYRISYPLTFTELDAAVESVDLALAYPTSFTAGTNLSEAKITAAAHQGIEVSNGPKCLTNPYSGAALTESVMHDGQKFFTYNIDDAGMGQRYNYRAYQTLRTNICYTVVLQLHSGAIENYDSSMNIKAFDSVAVNAEFEKIFKTFKFLK